MRVLFLLNYAGGGGAENYVQGLIERLHPHTAQCILCCNAEGPLSERMRRMGVEVLHLPMRHPFDRRAAKALAAYCIGNRIDIVHAQFPRENMIALRSRRFGSPAQVVYTAHLSRRQPLRWRILNRRYLRGNAAVIALQEEQKPLLLRNGVPEELLRVIPNGVAPPETPVLRPPAQGTLTLLTMARFSPEKGLLFLCDAVAALREKTAVPFRLVLLGDGPQRKRLARHIARKHLEDVVSLPGYREDVSSFLAQAHIYVSSSHAETMSYSVLEAMACALPVMATDASRPLLCENGVCGLTAPYGDVAAFADGLLRLLVSPTLRENLGKAAAEKVRSRYDLTQTCRKTAELYQRSLTHGTQ